MTQFTVDRAEGDVLVCFTESGERLDARLCGAPKPKRPEGRRLLVFDAVGRDAPYALVPGSFVLADGRRALIFEPDEAQTASVRAKFDKIFKKRT